MKTKETKYPQLHILLDTFALIDSARKYNIRIVDSGLDRTLTVVFSGSKKDYEKLKPVIELTRTGELITIESLHPQYVNITHDGIVWIDIDIYDIDGDYGSEYDSEKIHK